MSITRKSIHSGDGWGYDIGFGGLAWIHLRVAGDRFNVSPQRLVVTGLPTSPYDLPYAPYVTPEARQAAIDSYRRE